MKFLSENINGLLGISILLNIGMFSYSQELRMEVTANENRIPDGMIDENQAAYLRSQNQFWEMVFVDLQTQNKLSKADFKIAVEKARDMMCKSVEGNSFNCFVTAGKAEIQ